MPRIDSLYRYPVKGLSPERLANVTLTPGETFPNDRAVAIEQGAPQFEAGAPRHFPKVKFLMLMRDEKLAALETHFDDATATLTVKRGGKQVCKAQLSNARRPRHRRTVLCRLSRRRSARQAADRPGGAGARLYRCTRTLGVADQPGERPRSGAGDGRDRRSAALPANFYVEGLTPWAEKAWTAGHRVTLGGVALSVRKAIVRCAATNVNPATAERDMHIPKTPEDAFGANLCGVYLAVETAGVVRAGDPVTAG